MNPIEQLQLDIYDALSQDDVLDEVAILSRKKGVTVSDVENALQVLNASPTGKIGAVIIVNMPTADVPLPDPPGPRFEVNLQVLVIEKPLFNQGDGGTGLSAEELTLEIVHLLHGRRVHPDIRQIYAAPDAITPLDLSEDTVAYEVNFKTHFGLAAPERVRTPVFSGDADALQLSCNTPAASIYYTTDGSYPTPDDTLYGITLLTESGSVIVTEDGENMISPQPLTPTAGTTVRAVAYATGLQASDAAAWSQPEN